MSGATVQNDEDCAKGALAVVPHAVPISQGLAPLISRLIEDSSGRQALAF